MIPVSETRRECVVLFARTPAGEESAKRIARSRKLFECSRRRIRAAVSSLPHTDLIIATADAHAAADVTSILQRGNTFGERFQNAMEDVQKAGYQNIVAIPIDVPLLTASHLRAALASLRTAPLVLGPSPDGGVYLIGFRTGQAELFSDVAWQTGSVFETLAATRNDVVVLPLLRDVDSASDVVRILPESIRDREIRSLLLLVASRPSGFRPERLAGSLTRSSPSLPPRAPPSR